MNLFPRFTGLGNFPTERRTHERRQLPDSSTDPPSRPPRKGLRLLGVLFLFALLGMSAWKWRYLVHGPVWLARTHWADRSDLYLGSTNTISNQLLVQQARTYLTDLNRLDASGNISDPASMREEGVHIDLAWFKRHAPSRVDFDPFASAKGQFVVSWHYFPGCQRAIRKSVRADAEWYDAQGEPCNAVCDLSVQMAPNLRLISVALHPPRHR